ncbi:MAG TPA: hypothetical protein VHK28_07985 [Candidatus Limnocylindria bacterium]|nr:hypothetical protein [Candidatus Limnocylindria bacterium]
MTQTFVEISRGQSLVGRDGKRIGTVDAVFADYLLVRTSSLLPVDLYVPRNEVSVDEAGEPRVDASAEDAYEAWHSPLRRVAHD